MKNDPLKSEIAKTDVGRFTVLDRMTGCGYRDIESGFKDKDDFYLRSGNFDIRNYPELSLDEAIELIKQERIKNE